MALRYLIPILAAVGLCRSEATLEFTWPTPNPAYEEGRPFKDYVQPTVSGLAVSGLFGCVRSDGHQFHEGLDLKATQRDRRGEPTDDVRAIQDGVVVYLNRRSGNSSFGIYIVIEHRDLDLTMISLYAHLRHTASGLSIGDRITSGQVIGMMGRTSAGYSIPRERGHLHLETGLYLSNNFQSWYNAQKFGNINRHGVYNGMDTVGFDFHDLVDRLGTGEVGSVREYLLRQPTAVTVEWRSDRVPDFVERYPQLLMTPVPSKVKGWRVDVTWYGLPVRWTPLENAPDGNGERLNIVFVDRALLDRYPCLDLVKASGGRIRAGTRLKRPFNILFAP